MGAVIRTAIFFLGWIALTCACGILFLPALLSQRATWYVSGVWARITLAWLRVACGIQGQVRGQAFLNPPALIASKHQSAWDTLMLWRVLGNPAFILKRSLYYIPIFGWYLARGGHIGIDRKAGREAMRTIFEQAPKLMAQGRSMVIFPEGTRIRPGQQKPFHAGVARISRALKIPVVPAALNAGSFWPKHTVIKYPGTAVLEFLPPVAACDENQLEWLGVLQRSINAKTAELEAATGQP